MALGITFAVLGSGAKACEIAQARANVGHRVRIYAPEADALEAALDSIRQSARLLSASERQRTLDGIIATTDLEEALSGAAVVIDARN